MASYSIDLDSLSNNLQSKILGKLSFMDDILTGKIPKPPGMTINAKRPKAVDKLFKSIQSEMQIAETSNEVPPLFKESDLSNLASLNKHKSNPKKYPLSSNEILSLHKNGYVIIDDFISDKSLICKVQNEIDAMNKMGKMKKAGLRQLSGNENGKNNIEITQTALTEINGIYQRHKTMKSTKFNHDFIIISDFYYAKNSDFMIMQIETTSDLQLFVDTKTCWIICKESIIFYVSSHLFKSDWQCVGGIDPLPKVCATNKWISSSVRSDLHCWLHSDDADIGKFKSLKQCIVSMDEVRVQLNKVTAFNSNSTQCQVTLYPANGTKYIEHVDEPKREGKNRRRLTVLLYFNDDYKKENGGCLRMNLGEDKYEDVEPCGGRCVIFNSQWLPHQVMPCYFDRYAVTLWLY